METLKRWLRSPFLIVLLLIVFGSADLILAGLWFDLSKSDWATWVGSVGTIGTLIGTIWISTAQSRRTANDEMLRARLHAAAKTFSFIQVSTVLGMACDDLRDACQAPGGNIAFDNCTGKIAGIMLWHVDDLIPMSPLPGNAAAKLATVADMLRDFGWQVRTELGKANTFEQRKAAAIKLETILSGIKAALDDVIGVCHQASQTLLRS
jgi:hypothetical protein